MGICIVSFEIRLLLSWLNFELDGEPEEYLGSDAFTTPINKDIKSVLLPDDDKDQGIPPTQFKNLKKDFLQSFDCFSLGQLTYIQVQ